MPKKSKSGRSKAEITAAGRKLTKEVYKREMAKEAEMGGRIKRHIVSSVKEPVGELVKNVTETKDLFVSQHKRKVARAKKMIKDFRGGTSNKRRYGNKK
jgi:hypothetical protein